jgi:hypothetical protein
LRVPRRSIAHNQKENKKEGKEETTVEKKTATPKPSSGRLPMHKRKTVRDDLKKLWPDQQNCSVAPRTKRGKRHERGIDPDSEKQKSRIDC